MSAIEASSGTYRSRVDGTIILSVEIEPRNASAALALFGMPGTPMALAALQAGYMSKNDDKLDTSEKRVQKTAEIEHEKPKGGPIAKLAGIWSADPEFWAWLKSEHQHQEWNAETSAEYIRGLCGIESRAELDHNPEAEALFHTYIRANFSKYLIARGIVR